MFLSSGSPPRWISFDCYGTLIDWQSGIRCAFEDLIRVPREEAAELTQTWERIQWEKIQGPYVSYEKIMQDAFRETLEQFGHRYGGYALEAFVESLGRWEPFHDVNPALIRLSRRYKLAIISNSDRLLLGRSLRQLTVRFDALITAEDVRVYKPNPEVFRYALRRLACPAHEVAHVAFGADYDLEPAHAIGFRAVYLNREKLPVPEVPLEAEISDLGELSSLWEED
ncbi:MAG: haloacid dehalogenase type II [Acidobacteria bacterium]|nr:haloacid dehalogenase type II [Acidobacteriota bacterium]